jgi:hypothetical protein
LGATLIVRLAEMTSPLCGWAWDNREHDRFPGTAVLLWRPDDPSVFATAFILFQRSPAHDRGRGDRWLEQLRREPYVRHELPMIGRAVRTCRFEAC